MQIRQEGKKNREIYDELRRKGERASAPGTESKKRRKEQKKTIDLE